MTIAVKNASGATVTVNTLDDLIALLTGAGINLSSTSLAALESITVVDGGGSLTVDGTVAATQSGTWDISSTGLEAGLGDATDAESTGNGTLVAVTKRLRTLLSGGLPSALTSNSLQVWMMNALAAGTDSVQSWLRAKGSASGDTELRARTPADGQALQDALGVQAVVGLYDGTNINLQRGNLSTILKAAGANAATVWDSAAQKNYNHRGVMVVVTTTAIGTGTGLVVRFQTLNGAGTWVNINTAPTAITTVTTTSFMWYPGASATGTFATAYNQSLPLDWRIEITNSDASSWNYSVIAYLVL